MRDATPEPRTAVMILVEASWEDQSGTLRRERARMENTSNSGACIRVKKPKRGNRLSGRNSARREEECSRKEGCSGECSSAGRFEER
jgi:hypothetical protein